MRISIRRMVRTAAMVLAIGAGLEANVGHAQVARDEPKTIYTNKNSFHMPVKIDDQVRADLKEICLYVKQGAADWVRQETAAPSIKFFAYRVPQDGEYWFSVATIDKSGRMMPPDVGAQPPGLKVVVDTNPPTVDLKPANGPDGEPCVLCSMTDAHPDPASLQIHYRGRDGVERMLEPHPAKQGMFHVPDPNFWGNMARVTAGDRCGNRITRELQMSSLQPAPLPVATMQAQKSPPPLRTAEFQDNQQALATTERNSLKPPVSRFPVSGQPFDKITDGDLENAQSRPKKLSASISTGASPSDRLILNTQQAAMEYRIDQVGPSGVGKVEVWCTTDSGNTWRRLCEDKDRHSPAEMDLPGEGLFGIRLVVANGLGFGGPPPVRGDQPTSWIEVDTTPPFVQLGEIEPVAAEHGSHLEIRWKASDKNLTSDSVALYYRTRSDGPWKIIARNLKNDGPYHWDFPHDLGSKFYFKVEAADQAGNIAFAESQNPVLLDLSEPRASVLSITGRK